MVRPQLERSIGIVRATAMVVGTIIGASIFVQPSLITGQVPSIPGVFAVWAIAGTLTLFGALVCAELSSVYPRTGGVYVFLSEEFSPAVGFLWGWAMFWSMHSGILAAIAVVFARYVGYFAPLGDLGVQLVAIGCILVLSAVNYIGVRQGSALQTAFTIGKVAAIVGIVIAGLLLGSRVPDQLAVGVGNSAPESAAGVSVSGAGGLRGFVLALIAGLFAFGGWHMVTYAGDETVEPERTIPRALLVGTLVVTACYIALNAVYLYILPLETVISSSRVAADAADAVLGRGGGAVMSALVIFSTFGALSGIVLAGPRVYYAMASDGLLFRWLGEVHPRFRTPHRAIVAQAVWSSVLVVTGTYQALFTRVVYTEWIFFGLMAAGLFLLRRRPEYSPRYTIWGFPVIPAVFVLSTAVIVGNQLVSEPGESAFGLALVLVGFPVYYIWLRARGDERGGEHASR
ncbi:MAG: amino acid permease [Gemmatimonadetes bacterium]|nr:amino acid permease [Gemmatimonadota bacterium]NIO33220.1 amino acid permease [Gemmatimonadota bacterium]